MSVYLFYQAQILHLHFVQQWEHQWSLGGRTSRFCTCKCAMQTLHWKDCLEIWLWIQSFLVIPKQQKNYTSWVYKASDQHKTEAKKLNACSDLSAYIKQGDISLQSMNAPFEGLGRTTLQAYKRPSKIILDHKMHTSNAYIIRNMRDT